MASFFKRRKDEIFPAKKVEVFCPNFLDADDDDVEIKATRGFCYQVPFSPDESYFAWLSSSTTVVLVPWNREQCSAERSFQTLSIAVPSSPTKDHVDPEVDGGRPLVTIEYGYPVLSMAFGSGQPQFHSSRPKRSKSHWTRFDLRNEIVLATGHTNGRVRVWSVCTGNLLLELIGHKMGVRDLAFAPDGSLRLISASLDKTLKGWDLHDDGSMFKTFCAHQNSVVCCSWSANGRLMASAGADKTAFIWDMVEYKAVRRLDGHLHEVVSCSFSPDGGLLATASWDSQVFLWDPYTGAKLRTLYHLHPPPKMIYASGANSAWVRAVSFSRNGLNVATVSDDHLVRFWNLTGDVDPEGIATENEEVLSCAYSPSGRCLAVGTSQFKVTFYTTPAVIPSLCNLARMAIRQKVITPEVDSLEIPMSLKTYLKYESWK